MTHRLYGTPGSLYTGKARAYLIKQGVDFENRAAGEPRFREEIVPRLGRWIIPVLETPDGELVQDGSEIIAHFEAAGAPRASAYPVTPRHAVIAAIFELFGGEGLLRPAMHYRWNFDEVNRVFLARDFPAALAPPGSPPEIQAQVFQQAAQRMRKAMRSFGVTPETVPEVEASYLEFLDLFDTHLAACPYLLGGRPCLGDFGSIAPLFAHLGRDPMPARIMQQRAYRVWRWVERMNSPDQDAGEYGAPAPDLFADDAAPETLKALLAFIARDYLPEVHAFVAFAKAWLLAHPDIEPGTSGLPRSQDRSIGQTTFQWRGHEITVGVVPYRLYLLQKVQAVADAASSKDRQMIETLLDEVGLSDLLTLRTSRLVLRSGNLEVWSERGQK